MKEICCFVLLCFVSVEDSSRAKTMRKGTKLTCLPKNTDLKGTQCPTENAPKQKCWNNLKYKGNKIVLDHSPKLEINMHELLLI